MCITIISTIGIVIALFVLWKLAQVRDHFRAGGYQIGSYDPAMYAFSEVTRKP